MNNQHFIEWYLQTVSISALWLCLVFFVSRKAAGLDWVFPERFAFVLFLIAATAALIVTNT